MRKIGRVFSIFMAIIVLLGLFAVTSAAADGDGDSQFYNSSTEEVLNRPETKAYLAKIMGLTEKAKAGDTYALNILKQRGKSIRDVFPNGEFVGDDWRHAVELDAKKWMDRKFTSLNIPQTDSSPRLQSAAAGGLVPYRSPAPSFSRNLLITRDIGTPIQNEPHVCVSPEDPDNVIVASHNYGSLVPPVQTSFDGGETWQGPQRAPLTLQSYYGGDPVLACGQNGNTYYSYMSIGSKAASLIGYPISVIKTDIALSASDDGGVTWQEPSVVSTNRLEFDEYPVTLKNPYTGEYETVQFPVVAFSFLDKNWVAVGPNPDNPDKDVVYVSFSNFTDYLTLQEPLPGLFILIPLQYTSEIEVFRSLDQGRTWEKAPMMDPVPAIKDLEGTMFSEDIESMYFRAVQGSQLGVSQDGSVYAAWFDSTYDGYAIGKSEYYVAKSGNAGGNWSEPVLAASGLEVEYLPKSAAFRNNSLPQMAVGLDGDVYLVYPSRTETKPDEGDVYFVRGERQKGSLVFTDPIKLNQDRTNNLQFFPTVAVGPDGIVHAMWGDTRDDSASVKYHIYYSKSEDRGESWGFEVRGIRELETRVTDFPSNPNYGFPRGRFIGDYFGIAASEEDVYMVWTDSRLGEYGPMNQKIGFARRSAIASPEVYLNPDRGSLGQKVTVQAFNFQPDMSVFVQVGTKISACGRKVNESGFTECSTLIPPIASDESVEVFVFDESGNTAIASFYVDFGFDNLKNVSDGIRTAQKETEELVAASQKETEELVAASQKETEELVAASAQKESEELSAAIEELRKESSSGLNQTIILAVLIILAVSVAALAFATFVVGRKRRVT